jgi:hypothetical protein
MRYSELIQFHATPETKKAIQQAAASRGIKPAEWLRNAAATGLAMDSAVDSVLEQDGK